MRLPHETPKITSNIIREVFDYIHRFKDQVFVIKLEDDLLDTPLFSLLIRDVVLINKLGIKVILVPGARYSIDKVLKTYGKKSQYKNNIRITGSEDISLIKLGASNVANTLLTLLSENGATGVMGNWVKAIELGVLDGTDYGLTGKIDSINVSVIRRLLDENQIPILSNIGWNALGKSYNVSSNELALAIQKSMQATKLFFIGQSQGIKAVKNCKVPGLEVRENGVYSNLEVPKGQLLMENHKDDISPQEYELMSLALEACESGAHRAHIIDGAQDGILLQEIFSTSGHGTMFHAGVYANMRRAKLEDIPGILHIMQPYVYSGKLVQRTNDEIGENLNSYVVYMVDNSLHGCGAIRYYPEGVGEIEAIVVDAQYSGKGTGKKIVSFLLEKAKGDNIKQVFLLTTQASDFFMNLGFNISTRETLPEIKRQKYDEHRNSKVMTYTF